MDIQYPKKHNNRARFWMPWRSDWTWRELCASKSSIFASRTRLRHWPGAEHSALGGTMGFRVLSFFGLHLRFTEGIRGQSSRTPPNNSALCTPLTSSCVFVSIELAQLHRYHGLGPIASSLSNAGKNTQRALRSVRLSPSAVLESVKPKHYSHILKAEVKFSENRVLSLEFLRECVRYGKTVVMACTAFVAHSPFSRSRNSQDLVDGAASLGTERSEVSAETAVPLRGASLHIAGHFSLTICPLDTSTRTFNSVHKSVSLLQRIDTELGTFSAASLPGLPSWMPIRASQD
ncbi:hypothetical protein BC827DRAFT_404370 [Russula dissimulans]|nr:hypothetical protein BC827DRAFT_404370 [Russula dissimulans]